MKQTGLIQIVIEALGLDNTIVEGKFTPSEQRHLVKDSDGERCSAIVPLLAFLSTFRVILTHI